MFRAHGSHRRRRGRSGDPEELTRSAHKAAILGMGSRALGSAEAGIPHAYCRTFSSKPTLRHGAGLHPYPDAAPRPRRADAGSGPLPPGRWAQRPPGGAPTSSAPPGARASRGLQTARPAAARGLIGGRPCQSARPSPIARRGQRSPRAQKPMSGRRVPGAGEGGRPAPRPGLAAHGGSGRSAGGAGRHEGPAGRPERGPDCCRPEPGARQRRRLVSPYYVIKARIKSIPFQFPAGRGPTTRRSEGWGGGSAGDSPGAAPRRAAPPPPLPAARHAGKRGARRPIPTRIPGLPRAYRPRDRARARRGRGPTARGMLGVVVHLCSVRRSE